jgi:glutamate/tyrosine decarboxylase-like PLP-dependent enzyme
MVVGVSSASVSREHVANQVSNVAFGIFARVLPQDTDEFLTLRAQTAGLELADSITVDGHKLLNVVRDTSREHGISIV